MATHSSVLAWRIPGTGEPRGLLSIGSHIVGHDRSDLATAAARMSETRDACPEEVTVEINFTRREEIPMRTRKECHPKQRKLHVQKAEIRVA